MRKKDLVGLVLIPALALAGCSKVSDSIHKTPVKASKSTRNIEWNSESDMVNTIKQYPGYLMEFLKENKGVGGLRVLPEGMGFIAYYDIKGREDELLVFARYRLIPGGDDGKGVPDLVDYSVYDINEDTLLYKIVNDASPPPSEQYKPENS